MSKKKTHEEFAQEVESKFPGQFILLSRYDGRLKKIKVKCAKCGREWEVNAKELLNNSGCSACNNHNKISYDEFLNKFSQKNNKSIKIIGTYTNNSIPIKVKCLDCGFIWETKPQNLLSNRGCPRCGKNLKKTTSEFINEINIKFPEKFDVLGEYVSCKEPIQLKCKKCGHVWNALPNSILNGNGCPNCNLERLKNPVLKRTQEQFVADIKKSLNGAVDVIGEYKSALERVKVKCNQCGYIWDTKAQSLLYGHGCPKCALKKTTSKLQDKVSNYLESWGVFDVLHEKDCSLRCYNPLTGLLLPFDNEVDVAGKKLLIEVHGQQHYQITFFSKKDAIKKNTTPDQILKYQQWKDEYKKEYAIQNGYEYLEIPYWAEKDESYIDLINDKLIEIEKQKGDN